MNIGTMGAVIRIREIPSSKKKFFDIGIAGPLAGFVVSLFLLWYGFSHLPDPEAYIFNIHPEYQEMFQGIPTEAQIKDQLGGVPAVGSSLLFEFFKNTVPEDPSLVPPDFELMHYPIIFVGFLTLFFTALNLLPIGQLDGGHVIYGLFGAKASRVISRVAIICLVFVGGLGLARLPLAPGRLLFSAEYIVNDLLETLLFRLLYIGYLLVVYRKMFKKLKPPHHWMMAIGTLVVQVIINIIFPGIDIMFLWLIYAFIVTMVLGIDHPRARIEEPLSTGRKILGWLAILIFILSFSPNPLRLI